MTPEDLSNNTEPSDSALATTLTGQHYCPAAPLSLAPEGLEESPMLGRPITACTACREREIVKPFN
jgi:hypothetical protein